jgi:hypothetical protein
LDRDTEVVIAALVAGMTRGTSGKHDARSWSAISKRRGEPGRADEPDVLRKRPLAPYSSQHGKTKEALVNVITQSQLIQFSRSSPAWWRVTFNSPLLNSMGSEFVQEFRDIATTLEINEGVKVAAFDSVEVALESHNDGTS